MKIGLVLMSPVDAGGSRTALWYLQSGLQAMDIEFDILAPDTRRIYRAESDDLGFDPIILGKKDDIVGALQQYDGLILSDTFYGCKSDLLDVLLTNPDIPKWVSANHCNSATANVRERHERTKLAPAWCGSYVHFWPSARIWDDCHWEQTVLPWTVNLDLRNHYTPIQGRPYDFLFAGRTSPSKGVVAFACAMHRLTEITPDKAYWGRIAGSPMEMPGGPQIGHVSLMLEEWGWHVTREREKGVAAKWMCGKWSATHPASESTLVYTGEFKPAQRKGVLLSASTFVNCTPWKYGAEHLEYSTMEALETGMNVIAPDDWPDYMYGEKRPAVTPIPEHSYKIMRGARAIRADLRPDAYKTTYAPLAEVMRDMASKPKLDTVAPIPESVTWEAKSNRKILEEAHDPRRAAKAYLQALKLSVD
ncbi:glycosyltransferase [Gordonia phage Phendrix]|uniref:Glycosyltransferase n=1 Tax=Gordonia phage Phendrix TaxID=2593335 RepID=A0A514U132_9CAUD|nr:glycosyltransferase [Gordonia phage Phendrix]QDK02658.1 glycosyltransferase [Gordonia phage Phendrix]